MFDLIALRRNYIDQKFMTITKVTIILAASCKTSVANWIFFEQVQPLHMNIQVGMYSVDAFEK